MYRQRFPVSQAELRRPYVQPGAPKDVPKAREPKLLLPLSALRLPRRGANLWDSQFPWTLSYRRLIAASELSYSSTRAFR